MQKPARPQGFTLAEAAVVLIVLGMLTLLGRFAFDIAVDSGRDTLAEEALTNFSTAQTLRHDTLGVFASTAADAEEILGSYTFLDPSAPSSSHDEISFSTGSEGGEDFIIASSASPSGRCFMIKMFESSSTVPDVKRFFDAGSVSCSAAAAAAASGGDLW